MKNASFLFLVLIINIKFYYNSVIRGVIVIKSKSTSIIIAQTSFFAAFASILTFFSIPLFFVPGFYKMDLSEIVVLIGAFSLGPIAGITIEFLKIFIKVILIGTHTAFIGEFTNLLIGLSLIIPSAIIYKKSRDFKHAVLGMIVGTISMAIVSILANYLVLIPLYCQIFSLNIEDLIRLAHNVNRFINDKYTFILYAVLPFNLFKAFVSCFGAMLLYKKMCKIINKISKKELKF